MFGHDEGSGIGFPEDEVQRTLDLFQPITINRGSRFHSFDYTLAKVAVEMRQQQFRLQWHGSLNLPFAVQISLLISTRIGQARATTLRWPTAVTARSRLLAWQQGVIGASRLHLVRCVSSEEGERGCGIDLSHRNNMMSFRWSR